jgi:hypothetical protein
MIADQGLIRLIDRVIAFLRDDNPNGRLNLGGTIPFCFWQTDIKHRLFIKRCGHHEENQQQKYSVN